MTRAFRLNPWNVEGYLDARRGRLHMDGGDLVTPAKQRGTPLFVYSERRPRRNRPPSWTAPWS